MVERGSYEPEALGSSPNRSKLIFINIYKDKDKDKKKLKEKCFTLIILIAHVAQWLEQGSYQPKVAGSIPVMCTIYFFFYFIFLRYFIALFLRHTGQLLTLFDKNSK